MFSVALLASGKVDGTKAEPGERILSLCLLGTAHLDLASEPPPPGIEVFILSILGSVTVRVRPEQEVRISGFSLLGSRGIEPAQGRDDEFGLPLDVTAFALLGSVEVKRGPEEEEEEE